MTFFKCNLFSSALLINNYNISSCSNCSGFRLRKICETRQLWRKYVAESKTVTHDFLNFITHNYSEIKKTCDLKTNKKAERSFSGKTFAFCFSFKKKSECLNGLITEPKILPTDQYFFSDYNNYYIVRLLGKIPEF